MTTSRVSGKRNEALRLQVADPVPSRNFYDVSADGQRIIVSAVILESDSLGFNHSDQLVECAVEPVMRRAGLMILRGWLQHTHELDVSDITER